MLNNVTPRVGVWIETSRSGGSRKRSWSLPAWECGLKRSRGPTPLVIYRVTPLVGVWIETTGWRPPRGWRYVTPRVGVWIETADVVHIGNSAVSLPAWECGLKRIFRGHRVSCHLSLPAWECGLKRRLPSRYFRNYASLPAWECGLKRAAAVVFIARGGHSPRGSVD